MVTQRLYAILLLVLISLSVSCGSSGGSSNSGITASGIGPAGGSVNGFYSAKVTIPANALSTSVDIAITRDSTNAPALPASGIDTAGATYALTPHGTAFSQPATVQIPFDVGRIPTDATPVLYKAEPGGAFTAIPTTVNNNMLLANVANFSWVIPGYASTRPRMVYALTNTNGTLGVSSFKITKGTGALSAATSTAPVGSGPISVTVHPSRRFAYVTNGGSGNVNGVAPNSISVYQLDPVTGAISGPTDTKQAVGNPISAVVHPTGKFIYVVNEVRFGSPIGNVSVFTVDTTTGALSTPVTTADSGGAPATAIAFSPSGKFAYVTYMWATSTPVGNTYYNRVKTFSVDPTTGLLTGPIGDADAGDTPWAIVVAPNVNYAYVASLIGNEVRTYAINATTGVLAFSGSTAVSSKPASLAMDSQGRFLYIAKQQPDYNMNLLVYSINSTFGTLSYAWGGLTGSGSEVGPIAVVSEPQGQFVYVMESTNGDIVPYAVNASTGVLTPTGTTASGVYAGGGVIGVGDPFFIAAGGTSPVWQNGCTILVDNTFVFDGCPYTFVSSGSGGGGGGGGTPPPPAATHVLTVSYDPTWGGNIVSTPSGINYSSENLSNNTFMASFPAGSTVSLRETPAAVPAQAYDVKWTGTGGCSGTQTTTSVVMSQDQYCYLSLTPVSTR